MGDSEIKVVKSGRFRSRLRSLSFRTGVTVLLICVVFYILSFVQMALPIDVSTKSVLWVILFGLAKTFQYAGLTILGTAGVAKIKDWFKKRKGTD